VSNVPTVPEPFELLPAIDLQGGRVVRLRMGDLTDPTVYHDDPVAVAVGFVEAGARWIHVVDLDGASGGPAQSSTVRRVVAELGATVSCQVAGGLRDEAAVERMVEAGAARVVVGTAALRDPGFAGRLVERYGAGRVVIAIDVRGGHALGDGWGPGATERPMAEAMHDLAAAGVARFAVTAIDRDGLLAGPDLDLLRSAVALRLGRVIASGGVSSITDLAAVRDAGATGAIIGRALYEGRLRLEDALDVLGAD
jgi:phosphoribosylformimino-5-aminoimidazole carboxamide ribotide isomerase